MSGQWAEKRLWAGGGWVIKTEIQICKLQWRNLAPCRVKGSNKMLWAEDKGLFRKGGEERRDGGAGGEPQEGRKGCWVVPNGAGDKLKGWGLRPCPTLRAEPGCGAATWGHPVASIKAVTEPKPPNLTTGLAASRHDQGRIFSSHYSSKTKLHGIINNPTPQFI